MKPTWGNARLRRFAWWAKEPCSAFCNGPQPSGWGGRYQRAWTTLNWRSCCFRQCQRRRGPDRTPDFTKVHQELKSNRSVTLQLLWEEYKESQPDGVNYSWFCDQYRDWARHLDVVLRQDHRAGEKMFVDHAGDTIDVINPATGETRAAYIFVAVLGASNYTYAEATWTRDLTDWIGSHTRALQYFQGVTKLVVPDQWRAGVSRPCYWEPELNRTYQEWAMHNGVAIVPARPRHARDKAKVEQGVLLAQRWVVAVLRKRQFFSLAQLNEAIRELVGQAESETIPQAARHSRGVVRETRPACVEPVCRPSLMCSRSGRRFASDWTITWRWTATTIPRPISSSASRSRLATPLPPWRFFTAANAWPRIRAAAKCRALHRSRPSPQVSPALPGMEPHPTVGMGRHDRAVHGALRRRLLINQPHPEAGFRAGMGLRPAGRQYGEARLEAACTRAVRFKLYRLANVRSILATGLDQQPLPQLVPADAAGGA